ncbi:MAG: YgaP family membrane protein [Clostridia bacterium]
MPVNEGRVDRGVRVVIGLILGVLAYRHLGGAVGTWVFGIVGAVAFLTGVTGFCLLYRVFHVSTCPTRA